VSTSRGSRSRSTRAARCFLAVGFVTCAASGSRFRRRLQHLLRKRSTRGFSICRARPCASGTSPPYRGVLPIHSDRMPSVTEGWSTTSTLAEICRDYLVLWSGLRAAEERRLRPRFATSSAERRRWRRSNSGSSGTATVRFRGPPAPQWPLPPTVGGVERIIWRAEATTRRCSRPVAAGPRTEAVPRKRAAAVHAGVLGAL